ncbi:MAG: hypothetical protein MJ123_06000 [Lachnospiraceae bacterium]|nr:hypothetical protein [Lachnospiraceae bacterium]
MSKKKISVMVFALASMLMILSFSACADTTPYIKNNVELAAEGIVVNVTAKSASQTQSALEKTYASTSVEDMDMVSAYAYFLYDAAGGFLVSDSPMCFALAYVDDDDVLELLICNGNGEMDNIWVYKYDPKANDVNLVGGFGDYGSMVYYPKKNLIEDSSFGPGVESMSYYCIDDMDVISLGYLKHDMDLGTYSIDDVECDRKTYEDTMEGFRAIGDVSMISLDSMTRYSSCCKDSDTIANALFEYMD